MALDWFGSLVNVTAYHLARGVNITQTSRAYWEQHDSPSLATRRQVLVEAGRLVSFSASLSDPGQTGTLADLAADAGLTDYSPIGPGSQPAGARVYATVVGRDVTGATAYVSVSYLASWDATRAEIDATLKLMARRKQSPQLTDDISVDWSTVLIR